MSQPRHLICRLLPLACVIISPSVASGRNRDTTATGGIVTAAIADGRVLNIGPIRIPAAGCDGGSLLLSFLWVPRLLLFPHSLVVKVAEFPVQLRLHYCFLVVDARQRNERDARMGAEETGLEQVDSGFEFCCFY
jgi:hypothetical protein